ncbi:winged helix-turn-helix transcriptional regulator [[Enterobacter] lignolyticus]|uniref:Transcriptional regulator, HxlR family n=1 Tax=Enterobacter lignolyticus (strain SCF1) TaxID=701347 RepID=E3GD01_ENTLS|nr:helix-turn-helix domain-containing protein [[Enterobacter] lignolyticus]ADO49020.1 transcriptional regulator, HxlR family [[Enterobacter] lignolyticus SCF1]
MTQVKAPLAQKNSADEPCPMTEFVSLISGKWAIPILYRLIVLNAPVRFSDLLRAMAPITQKELTRQLRLFEQRGLVARRAYAEVPPRVEYQITPLGLTLERALTPLAAWMREYGSQLARPEADNFAD